MTTDELHETMDRLLDARAYPKTICPSEVARALSRAYLDSVDAASWRDAMPAVRQKAWQCMERQELEILQRGQVIKVQSLDELVGPIRLRRVPQQAQE